MVQFFLVTPIGFEQLALTELEEKFPGLAEVKAEKGGVEFVAPPELVTNLNAHLKIPSAILLRLVRFRVRDFPKLFKKATQVDWARYVGDRKITVSAAAQKSRLGNEKRIVKTVEEAIAKKTKSKSNLTVELQVRIFNDECTFSIDTSGEPLFKRGYKTLSATAPIRENLAAGLFYCLQKTVGTFDTLVDPMCGSGTFLFEAALFYQTNLFRSAMDFPFASQKLDADVSGSTPAKYIGIDRNSQALQDLQSTLGTLRAKYAQVEGDFLRSENWRVLALDFLEDKDATDAVDFTKTSSLAFIMNPPYGERIRFPMPPTQFYETLVEKLIRFRPLGFGIIVPENKARYFPKIVSGYKLTGSLHFKNGGIPVQFNVFRLA